MADRLIVLRDLASAIGAAGMAAVRDGARVAELRIDLFAMARPLSDGEDIWAMRLRHPRGGIPGFATLRRRFRRRRSAGWSAERLTLRWVPFGVTATLAGRRVGRLDFVPPLDGECP